MTYRQAWTPVNARAWVYADAKRRWGGGLRGAWGRNRTGTGFPPRDFRTTAAFAAARQRHAFVVWTLPLPSRKRSSRTRIRQGPSSLYTFLGGAHATRSTPRHPAEGNFCPNCHALPPTYRNR